MLIVPPVPVQAQTNPFDDSPNWRGAVAYPMWGDPAHFGSVRHDAYEQIYKACDGSYEIWYEGSELTPTETAEANRQGVTFPTNDVAWIVRFTCIPKPAAPGDANNANDPNKAASPTKK